MRASLGFIPAFWAEDGDMVLVDEVEAALEAVRHMKVYAHDVMFVTKDMLGTMDPSLIAAIDAVEPWGWDKTLGFQLAKANARLAALVPSAQQLEAIRTMSSRRYAAENLLSAMEEVAALLMANGQSVIKAPWSSSGRGIRYIGSSLDDHQQGWLRNIMKQQGGVTVEPLYNKVYDFGMEFYASAGSETSEPTVRYCGLSLFDTSNGAYSGSILATEEDKREMLSQYVDLQLLDKVKQFVVSCLAPKLAGVYSGPFGIDMMAVVNGSNPSDGFLLHPCVELNLRRTMGHVALALSPNELEPRKLMRIFFNSGKYKMRISTTAENLLNTSLV